MLETRTVSSPGLLAAGQDRAGRAAEVLAELADLFATEGGRIGALVIEPMVQAAGGMLTHDAEFVRGARRLCDDHGVHLIADEVATGVGRTGRMWACEHAGVAPDLLTCGRGPDCGYLPLSAVLATEDLYQAFLGTAAASARTFFHGHSYTANPLAAAAAIANLDLMAADGTVERAADVGERIGAAIAPLAQLDGVLDIRRIGTMTGIEVARWASERGSPSARRPAATGCGCAPGRRRRCHAAAGHRRRRPGRAHRDCLRRHHDGRGVSRIDDVPAGGGVWDHLHDAAASAAAGACTASCARGRPTRAS